MRTSPSVLHPLRPSLDQTQWSVWATAGTCSTTDSPYTAVLEGLPTQLALAFRQDLLSPHQEESEATFERRLNWSRRSRRRILQPLLAQVRVSAYTSGDPKQLSSSWEVFFFIPQNFLRLFDPQSLLSLRHGVYRSSGFYRRQEVRVQSLLMLAQLRSLLPRYRHQHSPESWIQYKELTKLWSMRKCFHKDSSHNSGISAQQREQQVSELRGSGQGLRRCKLECLLGRGQENMSTPRTHRNRSSFRCFSRERRHLKKARSRLAQMVSQHCHSAARCRERRASSSGFLVSANSWLELLLHWVRGWFKDQQK